MDASCASDEGADLRTAKSCGPDASTLASSLRKRFSAGDGDKKARSPGRARRKPLKPLRAGMPGESGWTCGDDARVLTSPFAREAAGAAGTRHSPRPLFGRKIHAQLGRYPRRGNAEVCLKFGCLTFESGTHSRHCEFRRAGKAQACPPFPGNMVGTAREAPLPTLRHFASLAMTVSRHDRATPQPSSPPRSSQ
jgi:hypothetical protein